MKITILSAIFLLAIGYFMEQAGSLHAQSQPRERGCVVPKAWGSYKGMTVPALVFEDTAGTIKFVDVSACESGRAEVGFEVKRQ